MSAPIELGENFTYRQTVYNASEQPANAGTVTAQITLPDGTSSGALTVTNSGTGLYDIDYPTLQTGRHVLTGDATGGVLGTDHKPFEDVFHVELVGRYLISLDTALTEMRADSTMLDPSDRQQLRWYILAASDAVERALGRVICRRSFTDVFDGCGTDLALRHYPPPSPDGFVTMTTLTESGTSLTVNVDYFVAKIGWFLVRGTTNVQRQWRYGRENITATYVTGCTDVPPVLRKIASTAIMHMWQVAQQSPHPALDADYAVTQALANLTTIEQRAWESFVASGFA